MSPAVAELWGRPGCDLCLKAAAILTEFGCVLEVSHEPPSAEDMADFAEHDRNPTSLPLVRITSVYGRACLWLDGETTEEKLRATLKEARDRNWTPKEEHCPKLNA